MEEVKKTNNETSEVSIDMKSVNKRLKEIENGIYTFAEVWRIEEKEEIERILFEKLKDNSITDAAKRSLMRYECDSIINGQKNFEDLPDILRENIESNENYMNYIKKNIKKYFL